MDSCQPRGADPFKVRPAKQGNDRCNKKQCQTCREPQ